MYSNDTVKNYQIYNKCKADKQYNFFYCIHYVHIGFRKKILNPDVNHSKYKQEWKKSPTPLNRVYFSISDFLNYEFTVAHTDIFITKAKLLPLDRYFYGLIQLYNHLLL